MQSLATARQPARLEEDDMGKHGRTPGQTKARLPAPPQLRTLEHRGFCGRIASVPLHSLGGPAGTSACQALKASRCRDPAGL